MRELAVYDYKNYKENGTVGRRPSVRGIIISNGKIAMVHSLKYDYYKLPGGGINEGESHLETLIREVKEESGLTVLADTVREYGVVIRKEKGKIEDLFIQENFYYLCEVDRSIASQKLDDYEEEEQFTLEWTEPQTAIETNLYHDHKEKNSLIAKHMMEREAKVLGMIMTEMQEMFMKENQNQDEIYMQQAIRLSKQAVENGNEPFGAVLVKDGCIVYTNENQIYTKHDPTFHGEMGLLRRFCEETGITDLHEYTLYSSCEPCFMCSGAMVWTKLGRLVYGASNIELEAILGNEGCNCSQIVFDNSFWKPEVTAGLLREEALTVLKEYFGTHEKG